MISNIQIASKKLFKYYIILFGLLFGHFPTKSHDSLWNFEPRVSTSLHKIFKTFTNFLINIKVLSMQTVFLLTVTL